MAGGTQLQQNQYTDPAAQRFRNLYVDTYFLQITQRDITRMVSDIRSEFERHLRSNPWLDTPTRKRARLNQPVVSDRFNSPPYTTPVSVNAAYSPASNGIDITAAILQPPLYSPGGDMAVNYCTVDVVFGHELTRDFDSTGRLYDTSGNVADWWTPAATGKFSKRTQLLANQFDGYEVPPGLKQSGSLTLTENTADLGGITLAHATPSPATRCGLAPNLRARVWRCIALSAWPTEASLSK